MPTFAETYAYTNLKAIVRSSTLAALNTTERERAILTAFNGSRPSIMCHDKPWLFKHRRIQPGEFRLVHHNNIPELVPYTDKALRRVKKPFSLTYTSETLGVYRQTEFHIGAFGHHVFNVPQGQMAKIFINNEAVLLGAGQHVVIDNNLRFDRKEVLTSVLEPYIQHQDIHILRVPPGKLAAVTVDNESYILESRSEPYVFKTQQFALVRGQNNQLFHDANGKYLEFGNVKRILPDLGEVAVINHGAYLEIKKTPVITEQGENGEEVVRESKPLILDKPTARFVGFLPTNIQNLEFPSDAAKQKRAKEGVSRVDAAYDTFYTQDSVKVGVKFFVCYRIKDPTKTLEHLDLDKIQEHIEGVVNLDMGRAIQKTSIQNLLSSSVTKPEELNEHDEEGSHSEYWQDTVKAQLKNDLSAYGIELIRLNIEEAKILNQDIEAQMSKQAITVAKATAEKAALQTVTEVEQAKAAQKQQINIANQRADNEIKTLAADAKLEVAKKEAEATRLKGEALEASPDMLKIQLTEIMASAFKNGSFSSTLPVSDFFNAFQAQLANMTSNGDAHSPRFFRTVDGSATNSRNELLSTTPKVTVN